MIGGLAARSLTDNLTIELYGAQFLGNTYNGYIADLGLSHVFMPQWRLSPFVTLGTGIERVEPKTTLVAPIHQNYQTAYVGFGARYYLARRFFLRAEYRSPHGLHQRRHERGGNGMENRIRVLLLDAGADD